MKPLHATFISSHDAVAKCPPPTLPEFAFIGRSNVGKSSLINMLVDRRNLAKISARPGKTQTINHYLVNDVWYLVDLPGYGYASVSKTLKKGWSAMIEEYLVTRESLFCLFILLDSRLAPQPIDIEFINWAGTRGIPICLLLTKSDKLSNSQLNLNKKAIEKRIAESWSPIPPLFVTSSVKKTGRDEIIDFIQAAVASQN